MSLVNKSSLKAMISGVSTVDENGLELPVKLRVSTDFLNEFEEYMSEMLYRCAERAMNADRTTLMVDDIPPYKTPPLG